MDIKTTNGEVLVLERNRIREHVPVQGNGPDNVWCAYYSAIRKAYAEKRNEIIIFEISFTTGKKTGFSVGGDMIPATPERAGYLGCKEIDYTNFRKLLRAAGATRTRKARAAKAGV